MNDHIKTESWKRIFNTLRKREDIRTINESKLRLFIDAVWFISRSWVSVATFA